MLVQIVLYTVAGLITAVGVMVLRRAISADRPNGRPRCPKCWYDMTGSRGFICPECGRDAVRQANLYRTRRDGMKTILGALLIVAGGSLAAIPTMQEEGWTALIPTSALMAIMPWTDSQWVFDEVDARINGTHPEWFDRHKAPSDVSTYQRFFAHRCAAVIDNSTSRTLRLRAVQLLSDMRLRDDHSEQALLAATNDVDPTVRVEALNALMRIASLNSIIDAGRSARYVVNCLTDTRVVVRSSAARFLNCLRPPPPDALPALIDALSDERTDVRVEVCDVLAGYGPAAASAVPRLTALIDDPDVLVSSRAMLALGSLGYVAVSSIDRLTEATGLDDRRGDAAMRAIARFGPFATAAIPRLTAILKDESEPDPRRILAVAALIEISPYEPAVFDALKYATTCNVKSARLRVASELGQVRVDDAEQARLLINLLGDASGDVRQTAFLSLARLVPLRENEVAELQRLAADPNFIGWEEAQSALSRTMEDLAPSALSTPSPVMESRR